MTTTTTGAAVSPTTPALRGSCTKCGYDLSGIRAAVCPECGTVQAARCVGCGYELAGLPQEGVCPECAMPVQRALAGRLLVNSSPHYLASLHRGVFIILAAIIAQVLLVILTMVTALALGVSGSGGILTVQLLAGLAGMAAAAALVYGWWLFSVPDPAVTDGEKGETARKVVRGAVIAGLAITALQFALGFGGGTNLSFVLATGVLGLVGWIVAAVKFFASMQYLQWLAPRIPDAEVARKAKMYMWLLPVLTTVGVVLLMLGPLIALILYWNLLDVVRKRLKMIRARQAAAA